MYAVVFLLLYRIFRANFPFFSQHVLMKGTSIPSSPCDSSHRVSYALTTRPTAGENKLYTDIIVYATATDDDEKIF